MNTSQSTTSGISIVEILISLALGSILALGVIQIFAGSQASNDIIMGEARLTENSRFAVDTVASTLRMTGHRTMPEELPLLRFGATNPAVDASDGDDTALDTAAREYQVTLGGAAATLDAVKANSDTITVQYQGLDDNTILNCLGQTVQGDWTSVDTFFVAEGATAAAAESDSADAEASRLALYCSAALRDASGVQKGNATTLPIANDVLNLQIELGDDGDGDGAADRFVSPSTAGLNMEEVVSVRLTLTMYGARPLSLIDRIGSETITTVERDLQRRFVRTISLRNLLS